jgi:hypothetical protein
MPKAFQRNECVTEFPISGSAYGVGGLDESRFCCLPTFGSLAVYQYCAEKQQWRQKGQDKPNQRPGMDIPDDTRA